jgi:hypothetical protein
VTPPDVLLSTVFPFVDNTMEAYQHQQPTDQHVSTGGFLMLLKRLRVVLLQDSVLLKKLYPAHKLWRHELFRSHEYVRFEQELTAAMATQQTPQSRTLEEVVPVLLDHLQAQHKMVTTQIERKTEALDGKVTNLSSMLERIVSNGASVRLQFDWGADAHPQETPQYAHDAPQPSSHQEYKMSRSVTTVTDLWMEWSQGVNGGTAVRSLEERHGARWRSSPSEKRFFFRRKRILDRVAAIARENSISEREAAQLLESTRRQQKTHIKLAFPAAPVHSQSYPRVE